MIKILDGDCPDPAVFREGDTFYLTYSSGPYYPGLPICSSTDLVNWKMETYAVKDFEGKEMVKKSVSENLQLQQQLAKMQEQLTQMAKLVTSGSTAPAMEEPDSTQEETEPTEPEAAS